MIDLSSKIITITGSLGSGKSTIGKLLSKFYNYEFLSTGKIQREIAKEMGMTTLELNKYSELHREIDDRIDSIIKEYGKTTEGLVLDSRIAWYFLPLSFKIFLFVDPHIAAHRIKNDNSRYNENYSKHEEALKMLKLRKKSENERFHRLYNADCEDFKNFDLILDTSYITPDYAVKAILDLHAEFLTAKKYLGLMLNPKLLYPTENIRNISNPNYPEILKLVKNNFLLKHEKIDVVLFNNQFFIFDGHKRTSSAINSGFNLIPVNLLGNKLNDQIIPGLTISEFIKSSLNRSLYYDWEDCHKFTFPNYPSLLDITL